MATLQELAAEVQNLQAVIDAEQQQIADAIAALETIIADLEAANAEGGTAEERDAVLAALIAAKEDLAATIPDAEVPEEPGEDV